MTTKSFNQWLFDMKKSGLIRFDKDAALLLGVSTVTLMSLKKNGSNTRTALACAALLANLHPFTTSKP